MQMQTIDELYSYVLSKDPSATRDGELIKVGGNLNLGSLTALPEGASLSAGGYLYLSSLTALPEGASLSAGGYLYLSSLTALPEGASLSAGGGLDLSSLTEERQRYAGKSIRLRTIDGLCTRLISSRKVDGVTIWSAQYFKGHLDSDPRCYVAQDGDFYAHGKTVEKALRDLRFKRAQANLDPEELVQEIKRRGIVTFNDYRLLTGACEEGLEVGLQALGKEGAEEMPLDEALRLATGQYKGDQFRRLFMEEAA
jgi:hypothetical protein